MQIRNGIDIIEVDRIKESIERLGTNFLDRLFTIKEQEYCNKSDKMKYQHYAARFAAKEAVIKAISEKLDSNSDSIWKKIEIIKNKNGKPEVNLEKLKLNGVASMDLSISHLESYAVASFTIIFE